MCFRWPQWIAALACLVATAAFAQSPGEAAPNQPVQLVSPPPALPVATQPAAEPAPIVPAEVAAPPANPELRLIGPNPKAAKESQRVGTGNAAGSTGGWWKTIGALALVLVLIYALKLTLRKYAPGKVVPAQSKLVEVLFRTPVSPKHQIMLVRIGQRVLVVGAGAEGMSTLAELTEPEQVSEVLGAAEQAKATSLSNNFSQLMRNWRGQLDSAEIPEEGAVPRLSPARNALLQVRGMLDQLRGRKGGDGGAV